MNDYSIAFSPAFLVELSRFFGFIVIEMSSLDGRFYEVLIMFPRLILIRDSEYYFTQGR